MFVNYVCLFLILSDTENHQVFLFDPTVVINYLYCLISDNIFMRYLRFYPDINNQMKLFFIFTKNPFLRLLGFEIKPQCGCLSPLESRALICCRVV